MTSKGSQSAKRIEQQKLKLSASQSCIAQQQAQQQMVQSMTPKQVMMIAHL